MPMDVNESTFHLENKPDQSNFPYPSQFQETIKELGINSIKDKYQTLFDNYAVAITYADNKERIVSWNKYTEVLLHLTEDELYLKPVSSLYPQEEWEKIRKENIRQKGFKYKIETKMIRQHHPPLDVEVSLCVLKSGGGHIVGSVGIIKDISKQKDMERSLKLSEDRFQQLYDHAPVPYHTLDPQGIITTVNEKWCELLGYAKEEVIGTSIFNYVHETEKDAAYASFQRKITTKTPYSEANERTYRTKHDEKKTFVIRDFFSYDHQQNLLAIYTIMDDVTQWKNALQELQEAHTILNNINKQLEHKVGERTAQIRKLVEQKDDFINQLGHDLKTPLTPMVALLPQLKDTIHYPEEFDKLMDILMRNVQYMRELVNNTITLAHLNTTSIEFIIEPLNLNIETQDVVYNNQLLIEGKHIEIHNNISKDIIVKADKLRLREVFNNLITNAIKYMQEQGGTITVDAKEKDDMVTIAIKDTGVGLSCEHINHIFNEFYKVDDSRHHLDSHGLGLTICRKIVEKLGGTLWVESAGLNQGSTFYFTLPRAVQTPDTSGMVVGIKA